MTANDVPTSMSPVHAHILRTLLYYDIWSHPLTAKELFTFLSVNSMTFADFEKHLVSALECGLVQQFQGFYYVIGKTPDVVSRRGTMEAHARSMWTKARISMQVIRRFPFVRAVMVSGDLSKNVTGPGSDVDFFIVTEPGRLWIARTLLVLFKKVFLLNSKKYFCVNSFVTSDNLELDEHNIFLATEVATLKPLYNSEMFHRYISANRWVMEYFPNWNIEKNMTVSPRERQSILQRLLEFPFRFLPSDSIDTYLLNQMKRIWAQRYPEFDEDTRQRILRCTKGESRTYVGNFQHKILALYHQRLAAFRVAS